MTWHFWLKDRLTQTVSVWTSISQHLLWLKYHDNAERDPGSQDHMRWQSCGQILYKHLALTSCQTNVRSGRCETCWAQPQLQWAASWLFSTVFIYGWCGTVPPPDSHSTSSLRRSMTGAEGKERWSAENSGLCVSCVASHWHVVLGLSSPSCPECPIIRQERILSQ